MHSTVVRCTWNKNGDPTYSSWHAPQHNQEDGHRPRHRILPQLGLPCQRQTAQGNIDIHSRKDKQLLCTECHKTFSATQGTTLSRLRTAAETVSLVVTLLAHVCPPPAIVAALGFDERTVRCWMGRGGVQGQVVQEYLVEQPRDLGHG